MQETIQQENPRPRKINLVQGTEAWLAWRRDLKIGGSEASVIMGVNRYQTVHELFQRKLAMIPEVDLNEAMARGHRLEPTARVEFEFETGISVQPACYVHSTHDWMAASLDGISFDERVIVEIKCPGLKTHSEALGGKVPVIYYPQLQHQLAVTNAEKGYYWSYTDIPDVKSVLLDVMPDEDYIARMMEREQLFMQYLTAAHRKLITATGDAGRKLEMAEKFEVVTEADYPPLALFGVPDAGNNRSDTERTDPKFLGLIKEYLGSRAVLDDAQAQLDARLGEIEAAMARKKQVLAIAGGVRVERKLLEGGEWKTFVELEGE